MRPSNKPTQAEIEIAMAWQQTSKLMTDQLLRRTQKHLACAQNHDPFARYAPLKTLLDDTYAQELRKSGYTKSARDLRTINRRQYATLLDQFVAETSNAHSAFLRSTCATQNWAAYEHHPRKLWTIRLVIAELRLALLLHSLRISFCVVLANDATRILRSCLPPARIIPIRT